MRQVQQVKAQEESHLLTYDSDEDNKKRKLKEIEMRAKQLSAKGSST
jgi:hypothetical protein